MKDGKTSVPVSTESPVVELKTAQSSTQQAISSIITVSNITLFILETSSIAQLIANLGGGHRLGYGTV